jgi:type IV pilus biogenesis protein CpaD/CtpE
MHIRNLAVALMLVPLAACTPNDTTFGGALRHNIAMQVIDPDPQYQGTPMEGGDGEVIGKAVDRYKKGAVKQTVSVKTTEAVSSK